MKNYGSNTSGEPEESTPMGEPSQMIWLILNRHDYQLLKQWGFRAAHPFFLLKKNKNKSYTK